MALLINYSVLTASTSEIKDTANIVILSIAVALVPLFIFWVGRQERLGKPAIIPNSLWKNLAFTCVCLAVFLTWAAFNSFGYFASLLYHPPILRASQPLTHKTQFPRIPKPKPNSNIHSLPPHRSLRFLRQCHHWLPRQVHLGEHPHHQLHAANIRRLPPHGARPNTMAVLVCCIPRYCTKSNLLRW